MSSQGMVQLRARQQLEAKSEKRWMLSTGSKSVTPGWRPDTRATRGPRPPEVPCLDLGRLEDSDEEDGNSYIPYSGNYPHTCPLDSFSDSRTSLQTPYAQHHQAQQFKQVSRKSRQKKIEHSVLEQKTIPENLPSPTDRYRLKYRQYEADMKEEYKQYSQRMAEKKKDHLQCPEASIKSDTIMSSVFQEVTPLYAVLQAHQKGTYRSSQVNLKLKK
ncbi:PREDICTED: calcyphosin-2-like [Nipponia nippon]|uniref:calcyphosin-2-like n=1 Tax=Nipponia nippon TaxID=128390 RepID=UPI000510CBE6|nr:PREDICTED: calcyphosin-2-like [Nipponia nippon]